jgi:hypothetical protein
MGSRYHGQKKKDSLLMKEAAIVLGVGSFYSVEEIEDDRSTMLH